MEKITLKYPVTVENVEIKELIMRRPKVRDQLAMEKTSGSDGEKELTMFANLCECSPAVFEELDMADYLAVQEVYKGFLSPRKKQ